jgi:hypothetical protein
MRYNIIINSSIAFVLAAILEMTLHEAGHFVASIAQGGNAILHHNYVQHANESENGRIITALAGPLVSLIIGISFQGILNRKIYKGMTALVLLYISLFGYIGFLGYVSIAPFFSYGDTGFVLRAIGCPMWGIITLALISVFITFLAAKALAVHFIAMMSKQTADDLKQRKQFIYALVFLPLFIGIAITTLLNLPVPTTLSLIAPLTSPFVILWPFGYYLRSAGTYYDESESIAQKIPKGWVVVLLIVIVINRLLVPGFEM